MYALVTTGHFDRRITKFTRAHPELKKHLAKALKNLEADPFTPSLKLHPLVGALEGLHAVSVTYAYRITLTLRMTKKEIMLLDIGSHDDVYR
ncbi:type II toxin-antitoxin system YafQ family toxin [Nitrospira sp. BLG_2]|uniref:type II toxin-antitoxin system RelE/ParE family toxin n=1 Tax=Nitrospira sp. BLG_2 TaxID=3397507 RepID=UPI003B9D1D36